MRALLIGQAPQRSATPDMRPWDSASGRRLANLMGCTHAEMMETFETDNLNVKLIGTNGKYDQFDMSEAKERAEMFKSKLGEYDLVLACGQKVVHLLEFPWLSVLQINGTYLAGMPHPGGTNHWWNDADNHERGANLARHVWLLTQHG